MKHLLHLCMALLPFSALAQTTPSGIIVNTSIYTNQQLIDSVFVVGECAGLSNITFSGTSANFPTVGYFSKGDSDFAFDSGILLSTGNVADTQGPYTGTLTSSSIGAPLSTGDADLLALNTAQGNANALYDASVIEFDFVPMIDHMSFDFIFASNEYGTFQCNYGDIFAFLLTDVATGTTANLAVVPGTTTPISVTSIRNSQYNSGCGSANAAYFGSYYTNPAGMPINVNGMTVPMVAESDVVPGHLYHIKLAIADYMDTAFDSTVFLKASSFNIGALTDEFLTITSSEGNALCGGQSTLTINFAENFNYQWSLNGEAIDTATTNSVTVTQPGDYTLTLTSVFGSQCTASTTFTLLPGLPDSVLQLQIPDYTVADENNDGVAIFNLATVSASLTQSLPLEGYAISYYLTYDDAYYGVNPLTELLYQNVVNPQTVYVGLQSPGGCLSVNGLNLIAAPADTAGVAQNTFAGLQYYPNPVSDALTLSNTTGIDRVEVYNLLGQLQLSQKASGTQAVISTEALQQGVYLVKLYSGETQKSIRVIKE